MKYVVIAAFVCVPWFVIGYVLGEVLRR